MTEQKDLRSRKHKKLDQISWHHGRTRYRVRRESRTRKAPIDEIDKTDFKLKNSGYCRMSLPEITIFEVLTYKYHPKNGCGECNTFFCPHIQKVGAIYFLFCHNKIEKALPKGVAVIIAKLVFQGYAFLEYPEPPPFWSFMYDKKRPLI